MKKGHLRIEQWLHGGYQGSPQWWLKGWVRTSKRLHSRCVQGAARSLASPYQSEKGKIKGDKTWRWPEVWPWYPYLLVLECWLLHWKIWKAPQKCWSEEGHNLNYLSTESLWLLCGEYGVGKQIYKHRESWRGLVQFSSVQSLSHVQLFVNPWTTAHQASLSITNSWSLPKPMSIESVMPPTISSSVVPFSYCPQSFPASGSFQMSQLFASGGQSIGVSASASVFPMITQDWSPLGWTG